MIMRRREIVAFLAGSVAWPFAVRAQQGERIRRVVFLHGLAASDPEAQNRVAAFREGLEQLGWIENRNLKIENRFSDGDLARMRVHVAELVASPPDVITASGTPVVATLKSATRTIPIVFNVVNDPAGQGFVASLARPGGNITGFSYVDFPMIGKWLEIFKEIVPDVRRITLMFNPETAPYYAAFLREFGAAATPLFVDLSSTPVRTEPEIESAVTTFAHVPGGGLIAAPDPFINTHRLLVMGLAQRHRLPTLFGFRQHVKDGALISYGPDSLDIVRRSASYVDRILKGENPAYLPVQSPTKYELAINLKTAKALGLTIPTTLLGRADEVID
jgi:putative tryptophan/tyrosine transport system substrate-binding protein